jgi:hypothetical protein
MTLLVVTWQGPKVLGGWGENGVGTAGLMGGLGGPRGWVREGICVLSLHGKLEHKLIFHISHLIGSTTTFLVFTINDFLVLTI